MQGSLTAAELSLQVLNTVMSFAFEMPASIGGVAVLVLLLHATLVEALVQPCAMALVYMAFADIVVAYN